jgi:glycosyltransferase involved in cell wall biosynthesis
MKSKHIVLLIFYLCIAPLKAIHSSKHFVIVIPSFNNSLLYKENLDSVFSQNYENYQVIYIDDCSNDQTADLVENYIAQKNQQHRCVLIKNKKRSGALENLWRAIHSCDPHDIIITVDGDDALAHPYVLEYLNDVYQNEDIWLTYGQFSLKSNNARGWCSKMPDHIVQNNAFRTFPHLPGHLRTFYAWLFQEIKLEDLITHRGFYSMTWDIAMMMPMIEMAEQRHQYIDEILYIYNDTTPINDDKINKQLQSYLARVLRAKKPYKRLEK